MNFSFEIVEHGSLDPVPEIDEYFCVRIAASVFAHFPSFSNLNEIAFCVVHSNNIEIQKLNFKFRNKDKHTNVLSFPLNEFSWRNIHSYKHPAKEIELGDIVFSIEKTREEAKEQSKNFQDYYAHLFIHSMLHLLGYDHENDEDAEAMENLENKILEDYVNNN
jgi:probable rRNA maturation factor